MHGCRRRAGGRWIPNSFRSGEIMRKYWWGVAACVIGAAAGFYVARQSGQPTAAAVETGPVMSLENVVVERNPAPTPSVPNELPPLPKSLEADVEPIVVESRDGSD